MNFFEALIIAIIEGITEYLPISSTAHMRIASYFMGLNENPFTNLYEVVIQLGAILAVVVIYYKRFFDIKKLKLYFLLILAVIPALVVGALLKKHIDKMLDTPMFIAIIMVVGGIVLLFIDRLFTKNQQADLDTLSYKQSFMIGCYQVLAIVFPGLSRSAATICGGMQQGLTRTTAAEFSFFLAVPTMLAASAKSLLDVYKDAPETLQSTNVLTLMLGFFVAFIIALFALRFFIAILTQYGFRPFGYYRIVVGCVLILVFLFNK